MMQILVRLTREENAEYYNLPLDSLVEMDLETYVFGVVASEISNTHLEACKAQAVAARTKAVAHILKGKPISDSSSTAQAFRASRLSDILYPTARAGSKATAGEVLHWNGQVIDTCAYSASNGGRTTSSEERWGGHRAYLTEQGDPWDMEATGGKKTGHGVGMSQAGAKWAALHGFVYTDILSFYFPGTQLVDAYKQEDSMTNQDLIAEFQKMIGWKYEWGAARTGTVDCSGAFVFAMKKYGLSIYHGSNTIWRSYLTEQGTMGAIS